MKLRPCLVPAAIAGLLLSTPWSATGQAPGPTCHGRTATVVGTPARDVFHPEDLNQGDVLVLRGGDDRVVDFELRVTACGGTGRDHLEAGQEAGSVLFDGGSGRDSLGSQEDADERTSRRMTLFGGPGNDRLYGAAGRPRPRNLMSGGSGRDHVFGFFAEEIIRGGDGEDRLEGGGNADLLYGGRGADELKGDDPDQGLRARDFANGGAGRDNCEGEVLVRCES
jgi:Ca2+-binding RTX toxin-like protein